MSASQLDALETERDRALAERDEAIAEAKKRLEAAKKSEATITSLSTDLRRANAVIEAKTAEIAQLQEWLANAERRAEANKPIGFHGGID